MLVGNKDYDSTIVVLFGGRSSEHEISLQSALFILKNLPSKYQIIPVGIDKNGAFWSIEGSFTSKNFNDISLADLSYIANGTLENSFFTKHKRILSVVLPLKLSVLEKYTNDDNLRILNYEASTYFPVLHGTNGEDGRLQGLFELAELAYIGCDIRASVIGIDKNIQKVMAKEAGVIIPKYELIEYDDWINNSSQIINKINKDIQFPCFIKPNSLGSAVGVNKAHNNQELTTYINDAFCFDTKILVEEQIIGTEIECAFLGDPINPKITVAGEIAPTNFYSYEEKYLNVDAAAQYIPARLNSEKMQQVRLLAEKLVKIFKLEGLSRIDFWNSTNKNTFVFNEINTLPGLTAISMFPKLWEYEGVKENEWIEELIVIAQKRLKKQLKLQYDVKALT